MEFEKIKSFLEKSISSLEISSRVLDIILPQGKPHAFESELWDYKRELPSCSQKSDRKEFDYKIHEIIKDIVSFYNSFGGYLIFGVEDKGANRVIGCENDIDCDDLFKRIEGCTGKTIQCYFKKIEINHSDCDKEIGVLLIPRRKNKEEPVKFIKNGPLFSDRRPYSKNDVYIRKQSQCIPASNSSENWGFLFSERKVESVPIKSSGIRNNLPPRDQDLIEFVGRIDELQTLRQWMFDDKSPIRLLTGIGGLGKTSLAYKFAEEVSRVSNPNIDAVIWITAKKETYAALAGKLVKTTRHDFSNISDLLKKLIVEVCGESSVEEDTDQEDLSEILIDGLSYSPSLIVVDDLDSLSPDDQKECALVLQNIALRTVGREHHPSYFLLTSRLDQGMPPTTVIKVSGLPRDAFNEHLKNLCKQFHLGEPNSMAKRNIFNISSGSPLFASAIIRMASLGETYDELCDSWSKADGEDVRAFAFKREVERLSSIEAKVLLTVLRLDTIGLEEIIEVVAISKNVLRDAILQLQAYHLLSRSEDRYGEIVFSASPELVSVTEIVRKHLGQGADPIDRACARLKKTHGDKSREIGIGIKKIVKYWNNNQPNEALVIATQLAENHPKNGDALCALGKAYMQKTPPNYSKADDALTNALKFDCKRKEIFSLVVQAKQGISDWRGIKDYCKQKISRYTNDDPVLNAQILAYSKLYKNAVNSHKHNEAAENAIELVQIIAEKITSYSLKAQYFNTLCKTQSDFALKYVKMIDFIYQRPGDKLELFNAAFRVLDLNVLHPYFITMACDALKVWFSDVESRPIVDVEALNILKEKINTLQRFERDISDKKVKKDILEMINDTIKTLEFRGAQLASTAA